MSYILDALKKSEGERVDNREVPDWKTSHQGQYTPTPQGPTRQQIVSISVLSGILVALLIGGGVWMYSGSTPSKLAPQNITPLAASQSESSKPKQRLSSAQFAQNSGIDTQNSNSASNSKSTKTTFEKFSEVQDNAQQVASATPKNIEFRKPRPRLVKKSTKSTNASKASKASKATKATTEPVVEKSGKGSVVFAEEPLNQTKTVSKPKKTVKKKKPKVLGLSELPENIRRTLPAIGFSGHVYSSEDPKQSSVMINGRKMKEGAAVTRELLLDKITESGAEFSFRGYHFRLGALQDWQSK